MKIAFYSAKGYDREFFTAQAQSTDFQFTFLDPHLSEITTPLAQGHQAVCIFVNDKANGPVLESLAQQGIKLITLRCAGFNNVDLVKAKELGIAVTRVPAYSPHAVAEHTLALLLTMGRKVHRAFNRVREGNFALEGLLGFELYGKTVGLLGTGKIGMEAARLFIGFGCRVLAFDPYPSSECRQMGVTYLSQDDLFSQSDIISLHCPLTPDTHHVINAGTMEKMRHGVVLVNTSRGALIDTRAIIQGLKSGKVGYLALDVYEEEADLFFEDLSGSVIQDDVFARLLTFPNVLITGHQAFFTDKAMEEITRITFGNLSAFASGAPLENEVGPERRV